MVKFCSLLDKVIFHSQLSSCIVHVCTSIGKFFKSMGQDKVKVSLKLEGKKKKLLEIYRFYPKPYISSLKDQDQNLTSQKLESLYPPSF